MGLCRMMNNHHHSITTLPVKAAVSFFLTVLLVLAAFFCYCPSATAYETEGEFSFIIDADTDTAYIVDYNGSEEQVKIPLDLGGKSVVGIADHAFEHHSEIVSVIFHQNIMSIGEYAFFDCDRLKSVNLPPFLSAVPAYAFADCNALSVVGIGEHTDMIHSHAFSDCDNLQKVSLPEFIAVGNGAFSGCASLTDIYYCGTEEQWLHEVDVDLVNANEELQQARVTVNAFSSDPEKPAYVIGGKTDHTSIEYYDDSLPAYRDTVSYSKVDTSIVRIENSSVSWTVILNVAVGIVAIVIILIIVIKTRNMKKTK